MKRLHALLALLAALVVSTAAEARPYGFQSFNRSQGAARPSAQSTGWATFTPLWWGSVAAWYRSDQGVTVVTGSATAWNDISGSGRNLTNIGSNEPTYTASDPNFAGFPSLTCSHATGSVLAYTGTVTSAQPSTILVAYRQTASGATQNIVSSEESGAGQQIVGVMSAARYIYCGSSHSDSTTPVLNAFQTLVGICNNTATALYASSSIPTLTGVSAGTDNIVNLAVGAGNPLGSGFGGQIVEVVVDAQGLALSQIVQWLQYTDARYGAALQ